MINLEEMKFDDYLTILSRRKWIIVMFLILGPGLGYMASSLLPKRYLSKSLLLIEQQQISQDYVQAPVPGKLDQRVLQIMETVLSPQYLQTLIDRSDLSKVGNGAISADVLRSAIKLTPLSATDGGTAVDTSSISNPVVAPDELAGFYVNVTYADASLAQRICSDITSSFIQENLNMHDQRSASTTEFLGKELDDAKRKLDEQDRLLAAFKSEHLGQLPEEEQMNMNLLLTLNTQLNSATQALDRAKQDQTFLQSMLDEQIADWKAKQSLNSPETIEAELAKEQIALADSEARYTNTHPDVIAARKNLEELQKRVADAKASSSKEKSNSTATDEPFQISQLRGQVHQAEETIKEKADEQQRLQKEIDKYQQRVQSTPVIEEQYKDLTRDHETALKVYNDLLSKQSESAMAGDMERLREGERFRLIEPPSLPEKPFFPNPVLFTGGGFGGGLILGLTFAILLETRDRTLHDERDVEVHLHLPVMASLPTVESVQAGRKFRLRLNG
jgi:polysaccharide chain length determinant protein (PEP-CTERM system associated)